MANSTDFRADQVQTSKIIVTGSNPQKTLLIYGIAADDPLAPNQGNINPAVFDTGSIGSDVFLFLSGAVGGRGGVNPVITVIGGDLHVSGNLTVDGTYPSGGGGGNDFFFSNTLDVIETSGSLKLSGSLPLQATYLSASIGMEITGSLTNGFGNLASGDNSHAEGETTTSSGNNSHAEGSVTTASGNNSHAEGDGTVASNSAAHAEGASTTASGKYAHAEGSSTTASGQASHSEGVLTNASGFYAHAEGWQTVASGLAAHAEGYQTTAEGEYAHATGYYAKASGTGSFAAGLGTVAFGAVDGASPTTSQAAFGKYNLQGNTDSLLVIGDGLDNSNRHDILRVNSGSIQVTGSLIAPTITGSIQYVDEAGTIPFLVNGANITTNYNSLGQWEITGSGGGGGGSSFFTEIALDSIQTTGSVAMTFLSASTGGEITGSFTVTDGTVNVEQSTGFLFKPYTKSDSNVVAGTNQNTINMVGLTAPRTVTLPSPITGTIVRIVNGDGTATSGSYIFVTGSSGDTIDGKTYGHVAATQPYGFTQYYCTNNNWVVETTQTKTLKDGWIDFITSAGVTSVSSYAGDYTNGVQFTPLTGSVLIGFRIKIDLGSPQDFDIKIWTGGSALDTVAVAVTGSIDTIKLFNSQIALNQAQVYFLTWREKTGSAYYFFNAGTAIQYRYMQGASAPTRLPPINLLTNYCYASGDAQPNTYLNTPQPNFIGLEPIIFS